MKSNSFDVLPDERVRAVLRRLHGEADRQVPGVLLQFLPKLPRMLLGRPVDVPGAEVAFADKYLAIEQAQGAFCYLTARALRARTIVEFGTSFGVSTLWLAAAVRDNGGGRVIGTELLPEKARRAQANLEEAGLASFAEIRVGDAMQTLRADLGEVDFMLNDGFPLRALDVLKLVTPALRPGAVVVTDNVGVFKADYRDYVTWVRDPRNGFASMTVPFRSGTEYSVRQPDAP
ncbi:O-methyltransferase [Corallococcus carmarthensis]|uniref:Methyltransferase n=1 Tax=Corallococcus carmarthensis TaxID=2316728 RepID=A0A3A8KK47_9BACT|nr:class I SAM-dependent methyltransferase [Corallococcus carmarthensis]NOK15589.1 methyltransferase [Corallococcus carmarthensis]RKH07886.1 methyltransferase [Corallococcus carmarthensis]